MLKKLSLWLAVVVLAISLAGCGASSKDSSVSASMAGGQQVKVAFSEAIENGEMAYDLKGSDTAETAPKEIAATEPGSNSDGQLSLTGTNSQASVNQKIIYTGQVDFETLNFEKTRTEITRYMSSIGAYQQNSSVKGGRLGYDGLKNAVYIFRVPKIRYNQAIVDLRQFGTVVFEQSTGEDVTEHYFDTEARLKSLTIRQDRLLELLQKAAKMDDILKLEKELQTVNYEIENLTGTLRKWDSLVEYSTLTVNINEVEEIKPEQPKVNDGLFHRISSGFKNSVIGIWEVIQDTLVFLAAAIPVLLPIAAIFYIAFRIYRKRYQKTKENKKTMIIPDYLKNSTPGKGSMEAQNEIQNEQTKNNES